VATTDAGVVGYAYAGLHRTRVAYRNTLEDSVYIDPQFHRRGIGRALLDRLVTESEARGYRQMVAVIGDSAQAGSIALHRAAGFRMIGTLEAVGHKFGRWIDTVRMQRALGAGATSSPKTLIRHHAKRAVDGAQHAFQLGSAPHDQAGRGNHAIGALPARQAGIFFDTVDRLLRGAAEHREDGAVPEKIDRVVAPFAGGDLTSVETEDAVELPSVEGDAGGGGGRREARKLAAQVLARIDFAGTHHGASFHGNVMIAPKPCLRQGPRLRARQINRDAAAGAAPILRFVRQSMMMPNSSRRLDGPFAMSASAENSFSNPPAWGTE